MSEQNREYPQLSCTISPEDENMLNKLCLELTNSRNSIVTKSEMIRILIRVGGMYAGRLDKIWREYQDSSFFEDKEEIKEKLNGHEIHYYQAYKITTSMIKDFLYSRFHRSNNLEDLLNVKAQLDLFKELTLLMEQKIESLCEKSKKNIS